jgi:hypothetical protein
MQKNRRIRPKRGHKRNAPLIAIQRDGQGRLGRGRAKAGLKAPRGDVLKRLHL